MYRYKREIPCQLVTHADEDRVGDTLPVQDDTSEQFVFNSLGKHLCLEPCHSKTLEPHQRLTADRA